MKNLSGAGRIKGLGFELNAAAINRKSKWDKGIIAGWQHTAFTKIQHSEAVKETYRIRYPDNDLLNGPIDGWYKGTGDRLKLGVIAGRQITSKFNLQFEFGSMLVIQRQGIYISFAHAQVPAYMHALLVYR